MVKQNKCHIVTYCKYIVKHILWRYLHYYCVTCCVWWPMRAKLLLWTILISKANFTLMFNFNFKINLKLLLFHLKIDISFISFQFFISNLLRKGFCFISCLKNLIWACGQWVPTQTLLSAVNHWKFCTLSFVHNVWPIEANHT